MVYQPYLMAYLSFNTILVEEQQWDYLIHSLVGKVVSYLFQGISPEVYVIARL